MSIKKNAISRIQSYIIGLLVQILTIFLLTTKLDILQFSVWGVSNSFIFVLSTVFQLSYCEEIEKYFPNNNLEANKNYLVKYIKTIIFFLPFIFFILFIIKLTNYFEVLNLTNLIYLLTLISFHSIVESILALLDSYYLAKNYSRSYDNSDLYLYKIPRLFIFIFLINAEYSVYYLLFSSLILRILFLIKLLSKEFKNINVFFRIFISNKITENNFINIKYTIKAFLNNLLYFSFLNLLFLISVNNLDSLDIAHFSLGILIINSLRPIFNSLPSILTPIVSKESFQNIGINKLLKNSYKLNLFFISICLTAAIYIIENKIIINLFLKDYFDGVYKLIFLSVFSSSLRSLYFNKYLYLLFKGLESILLKLNIFISVILLTIYIIGSNFLNLNFLYFYMFYELSLFLWINFLHKSTYNYFKEVLVGFNFSFFFCLIVCVLYMLNIYYVEILILLTSVIIYDFLTSYKFIFEK